MQSSFPWQRYYPNSVASLDHIQPQTLGNVLDESAAEFGNQIAVSSPRHIWTFIELQHRSHQLAAGFSQLGIKRGDRVAIALPNMPEYVASVFAIALIGAITVQVNVRYTEREINSILSDADPIALITTDEAAKRLKKTSETVSSRILLTVQSPHTEGDLNTESPLPGLDLLSIGNGIHEGDIRVKNLACVDDVAILQYTGGTTGKPKGVMLTHANLTSNIAQRFAVTYDLINLPQAAKSINVLPMCHVYGMTTITLLGIRAGMHQIVLPQFDVDEVLQIIKQERPSVFSGVPTMYMALNRHPDLDSYGLGEVQIFNSAGAGFPQEVMNQFEAKTGAKIIEGFGISEASPSTHLNPFLFAERRPGTVGIPLPLTEVRIVNQEGESLDPLPPGEVGEMLIKGPQVMKGYWQRPEETAAALQEGWLRTGDLARMDEDGYFSIVGRKKEMIITGGFNVYPAEVEDVIAHFPGISEVAVKGVVDTAKGEVVTAYIVTDPGVHIEIEDLTAHCRRSLTGYKIPKKFITMQSLPRTPVGKIAKNRLPSY